MHRREANLTTACMTQHRCRSQPLSALERARKKYHRSPQPCLTPVSNVSERGGHGGVHHLSTALHDTHRANVRPFPFPLFPCVCFQGAPGMAWRACWLSRALAQMKKVAGVGDVCAGRQDRHKAIDPHTPQPRAISALAPSHPARPSTPCCVATCNAPIPNAAYSSTHRAASNAHTHACTHHITGPRHAHQQIV
jgi:hypothetical protein